MMVKLNENFPLVIIFGLVGLIVMIILVFSADLAKSADDVTVAAVVSTSVSCDADPASMDFGTITTSLVKTATGSLGDYASTTISCNYGNGCSLYVSDQGNGTSPGLATSSPANLIQSETETLQAGSVEGYGLQATTTGVTGGGGGTLNLDERFNKDGDAVGAIAATTTTAYVASSTESVTDRQVRIIHKAAITGLTPAANYEDTITYSCLGN